ncbi:MBL fold metallo-hydrolase [Mycolicibacterium gilvum]|nr:MBL fold metallo-hydrolase [Mycolicibacterium gilvum]
MSELVWERLTRHVMRCRLPFCDVTVGVVHSDGAAVVIDCGTTLTEARAVAADVSELTGCAVTHLVLTHHHFDHVLGHPVFDGAQTFCSPEVTAALHEREWLRSDALRYGADPQEVDDALTAAVPPAVAVPYGTVELAGVVVRISHPGRGHTGHDLIAAVTDGQDTVVFCGDLVEESGEPCVDDQSDPAAWPATLQRVVDAGGESGIYVPGHGAVVDAAFVRRQAQWLAGR